MKLIIEFPEKTGKGMAWMSQWRSSVKHGRLIDAHTTSSVCPGQMGNILGKRLLCNSIG